MTQLTTSHSMGDYVTEQRPMMALKYVEDFVSVERMKERVDFFDTANLYEAQRQAVGAFRAAVKRREQGKGDFSTFDLDES